MFSFDRAKIKCFFGFHKPFGWDYFKYEYRIEMGMVKVRVYECVRCGKEFGRIV